MSTILVSGETLKAELMSVVSFLEDGDITGALRLLRALYTSTELQQELQRNALEFAEKALQKTAHLVAVTDEDGSNS